MRLTDSQIRAVMDEKIDGVNDRLFKIITSGLVMSVAGTIAAWAYLKWAGFIK